MSEKRHDVCIWQRPFAEYCLRQSACHVAADQFSHDQTPRKRRSPYGNRICLFRSLMLPRSFNLSFLPQTIFSFFSFLYTFITSWSKVSTSIRKKRELVYVCIWLICLWLRTIISLSFSLFLLYFSSSLLLLLLLSLQGLRLLSILCGCRYRHKSL